MKSYKKWSNVHAWLKKNYGKAILCENPECEHLSSRYEWALKKDCKYDFDRHHFLQLCIRCHRHYDLENKRNHGWDMKTIRVSKDSYKILGKYSKKEGRTIKGMFARMVEEYDQNRTAYANKTPSV